MIKKMMDQNQNFNHLTDSMDSLKDQVPTTVVPANKKVLTLEGGNSTKNGYLWTLKHEIS